MSGAMTFEASIIIFREEGFFCCLDDEGALFEGVSVHLLYCFLS